MHDPIRDIEQGWSAFDRAGDKIGEIDEIGTGYVHVQKGLIFTDDIYIPTDAIEVVDREAGEIQISAEKDHLKELGWDQPPTGAGTTGTHDTPDGRTVQQRYDRDADAAGYGSTMAGGTAGTLGGETESIEVPVREEELVAERHRTQAGEVVIDKDVVTEQAELDVPVTRDEVEVTRRAVDRAATGDEAATMEGDTIRVPVMAEEVDVTTRQRVVEEIEISKRPVSETEHVTGQVRRETVEVEGDDYTNEDRDRI